MTPTSRMGLVSGSPHHFPRSRLGANCQKTMVNRSAADISTQSGTVDKHRTLSKGSVQARVSGHAHQDASLMSNQLHCCCLRSHRAFGARAQRPPCSVRARIRVASVPYVLGVCFYLPPAQPPLLSSTRSIGYLIRENNECSFTARSAFITFKILAFEAVSYTHLTLPTT